MRASSEGSKWVTTRGKPPNGLFRLAVGRANPRSRCCNESKQIPKSRLASLNTKQNLVTFVQDENGQSAGFTPDLRDPGVTYTDEGDYKDFFARPLKILNLDWNEGASLDGFFSPWLAYFSSTPIINKLRGYSRLRANLHLKFLVNGSPFRYGDIMFSYRPLWTGAPSSTSNDFPYFSGGNIASDLTSFYPGGLPPGTTVGGMQAVLARSQRPHIHVYPQTNAGGEMHLPFLYPKDAINLTEAPTAATHAYATLQELGTVYYNTIVPLTTTASAQVAPVTISVYAWCSDVMLWGPTSTSINGVNEADQPIDKPSAVASAVAEAAGKLSDLPIIGPYATATGLAASTAARTLRLFGFSNPPLATPVQSMLPKSSFINPSPVISQGIDVLALDPKNESTIDPGIVGADRGNDPLNVDWICSRPAIIDAIAWNASDEEGYSLLTMPIAPSHARCSWITNTANPSTNCARITMTPATYVAQLFRYWRGTFRLHIKAVASNFHRGRLCVAFDPSVAGGGDVTGTRICKVLDLATADEMTLDIPMMNSYGFLGVPTLLSKITNSTGAGFTYWSSRGSANTLGGNPSVWEWCNGNVIVSVLNTLQCGDQTAPVTLVISSSFHDMQFMCPIVDTNPTAAGGATGINSYAMRNLTLNGGEEPTGEKVELEIAANSQPDHFALIYGGERVVSLRSLLQRTAFYRAVTYTSNTGRSVVRINLPRFPVPRHCRVPISFDSMIGTTGTGYGTNLCNTTPLAYLTGCFAGYRGSIVWSALSTEGYTGKGCYFSALGRTTYLLTNNVVVSDLTVPSTSNTNLYFANALGSCVNGMNTTMQSNNGVNTAVLPMYSNYKMFSANMSHPYYACTNPPSLEQSSTGMQSDFVNYIGVVNSTGTGNVLFSVAAGVDFAPIYFLNCPDLYSGTFTVN